MQDRGITSHRDCASLWPFATESASKVEGSWIQSPAYDQLTTAFWPVLRKTWQQADVRTSYSLPGGWGEAEGSRALSPPSKHGPLLPTKSHVLMVLTPLCSTQADSQAVNTCAFRIENTGKTSSYRLLRLASEENGQSYLIMSKWMASKYHYDVFKDEEFSGLHWGRARLMGYMV